MTIISYDFIQSGSFRSRLLLYKSLTVTEMAALYCTSRILKRWSGSVFAKNLEKSSDSRPR